MNIRRDPQSQNQIMLQKKRQRLRPGKKLLTIAIRSKNHAASSTTKFFRYLSQPQQLLEREKDRQALIANMYENTTNSIAVCTGLCKLRNRTQKLFTAMCT